MLGGDDAGKRLQGYSLQGWFASNITNDSRRGLGGWSIDEITTYLKTGHSRTSAATGPMSETLNLSTSHMSDTDLTAIATYLKDQTGQGGSEDKSSADPDQAVIKVGAQIYADECSGCHMPNGKGAAGLFPALDHSSIVQQIDPTSLMRVVLRGARSVATDKAPTGSAMPEFGWLLNDDHVAAVLTYIRNSWSNAAPSVSAAEVGNGRLPRAAGGAVRGLRIRLHRPVAAAWPGPHLPVPHQGAGAERRRAGNDHGAAQVSGVTIAQDRE